SRVRDRTGLLPGARGPRDRARRRRGRRERDRRRACAEAARRRAGRARTRRARRVIGGPVAARAADPSRRESTDRGGAILTDGRTRGVNRRDDVLVGFALLEIRVGARFTGLLRDVVFLEA